MKVRFVLVGGAFLAALLTSSRGRACGPSGSPGHLEVIPAVGGVFSTAGTSQIEDRLGAGVSLGMDFGWQLCAPKIFIGVGVSYALFSQDRDTLPSFTSAGSVPGAASMTFRTNHPGLLDVYGSSRVQLVGGLFANVLAGASSSDVIRARAVAPSGASISRSTSVYARDIRSEGGGVLGVGLELAFQGFKIATSVDDVSVTLGVEPRIHVFGSGSVWTVPFMIKLPIPLD